ncbi:hypothetical protein [Bradyrhizobium sp. CB2312]|uniref:hypothetical protein n=1 Tax=Bradyrhizobium sp. CB2312 TaxID=3039155 RepID=UPI0024B19733|nr:hypothetical protein [Bradyrhizobium sp. CB2312]WFU77247.1 hypothetical protein QA642_41485 [Bradyrhizobium sp. CB2312]
MEPGYKDPNYWMRWCAEQHEQRAQEADAEPPDQAGFEQQLDELQLRSSEQSLPEASSPEAPAARSHENIRRKDIGGSIPVRQGPTCGTVPSAARVIASMFRTLILARPQPITNLTCGTRPFSSMRYTAPLNGQLVELSP